MLAIKLQRIGKKHQPSYRLVVAETRSKMAAPPVEDLGSYQPRMKEAAFKKDRISYWLGVGAQPTVSVHNLLVTQGIVTAPKRTVKMAKPVAKEEPAAETAPATETAVGAPAEEVPAVTATEVEAPAEPAPEASSEETPAV